MEKKNKEPLKKPLSNSSLKNRVHTPFPPKGGPDI